MAQIQKYNNIGFPFRVKPGYGSGGNYGQVVMEVFPVAGYNINTNGISDYYTFKPQTYTGASEQHAYGSEVSNNTKADMADYFLNLNLGDSNAKWYYFSSDGGANDSAEGYDFQDLHDKINALDLTDDCKVFIEFHSDVADGTPSAPTWDDDILYRWDGSDKVYVVVNGTEFQIGSGITSQAQLETCDRDWETL